MKFDYKTLFSYATSERTPSYAEIAEKITGKTYLPGHYLWAEVENGRGWTYLVCWKKDYSPSIRRKDVFRPTNEEEEYLALYKDGLNPQGEFVPSDAVQMMLENNVITINEFDNTLDAVADSTTKILIAAEFWLEPIEGWSIQGERKGERQ